MVLLVTGPIGGDEIQGLIDQSGLNPLIKPSQLILVDAIPKLGSGKNDFSRARQIAMEASAR